MKLPLFCVVLMCLYHCSSGKIFTRCELARELLHQGFPKNKLPDWVCLVENESSRNTAIKSKQNTNKSYDWGLFQINDKYWCQPGSPGNDCKVKCEDLLTDDITAASVCAKKIFKRQGFRAWYGWRDNCQGDLPDLSKCF